MMDISEEIAIGLRFVLGFYLIGTQKDHFERHIEMGGNTADLLVPAIFAILFMVSAPNIDIAMLMDAGNQSSNLSRRGNIFEPDKTPGAPYAAQRKNITAFAGSPPYVDGVVDEKDGWNEGENIISRTRDEVYNITVKHDFENLYILIEWEGPPEWQDGMAIYFEQDEEKPDFNLSNGRVDNYYQGDIKYGPDNFRDAHYNYSGYNVKETQNGKLKTGYVDGMWSQEWQLPLRSQDQFDIYIDKYPTQLGFSIINRKGAPYGIFPVNAWFSRPESWGMMKIVDSKKQ